MPSHAPRTTAKKIVSVAATLVSALLHAGLGTLGISIAAAGHLERTGRVKAAPRTPGVHADYGNALRPVQVTLTLPAKRKSEIRPFMPVARTL